MTIVLAKRAHVENFTPPNYLPELPPRATSQSYLPEPPFPQKILNLKK